MKVLILPFILLSLISSFSNADELQSVLTNAYPAESELTFVKHESVIQAGADEQYSEKFMVLDFELQNKTLDLQASIHSICNTVLSDQALIKQLSNNGYDMISVSFDTNSQYDCL